jgi:hypothetical protein
LSIFHGLKVSSLEVPTRNLRDFPLSHFSPSFKTSPYSRRATVANSVSSYSDIFSGRTITLRFYIIVSLLLQGVLIVSIYSYSFVCVWFLSWLLSCCLYFLRCAGSVTGHLPAGSEHWWTTIEVKLIGYFKRMYIYITNNTTCVPHYIRTHIL